MKEQYIEFLKKIIKETKEMDDKTHWCVREPEWWLQMMDLQRKAYDQIGILENEIILENKNEKI